MNTKELMVGDWVTITEPDDFHGYIGKVVIINAETNYITVHIPNMHLHDVFVEDLQPIPLTSEILEKNGFDKFTWWKRGENDVTTYSFDGFQIQVNEDGTFSLVDNCSDGGDYGFESNWICDIKHMHNLQHLLKDLEIEKEIIL